MKKLLVIFLAFIMIVSAMTSCDGMIAEDTANDSEANGTIDNAPDVVDSSKDETGVVDDSDNETDETTAPEEVNEYNCVITKDNIVDIEYIPAEENLVGLAVYPLGSDDQYTHKEGDMIPLNYDNGWKTIYMDEYGVIGEYNVFDPYRQFCYAEYSSETDTLYWGYIYEADGEQFILATRDLVDLVDGRVFKKIDTKYTYEDIEGTHRSQIGFEVIDVATFDGVDRVDVEYVPDTEKLVGIAICPIGDDYRECPYDNGQKVDETFAFSTFGGVRYWEFIYFRPGYLVKGQYQLNYSEAIIDYNVTGREEGEPVGRGTYVTAKNAYLGYVYADGDGDYDIYIVATQDLVNFEESSAEVVIETDEFKLILTVTKEQ